jgi:cytochrome c oxidase cbb3-type subunit 4
MCPNRTGAEEGQMDYQTLRTFADSWGLVFMGAIFLIAIGWALRPGSRAAHDDARMIPFRDDEAGQ